MAPKLGKSKLLHVITPVIFVKFILNTKPQEIGGKHALITNNGISTLSRDTSALVKAPQTQNETKVSWLIHTIVSY